MSAAGARGLRATYHRLLDKVEFFLPEKLRPLYNHPAGKGPRVAPAGSFPASPPRADLWGPSDSSAAGGISHSPSLSPSNDSVCSPCPQPYLSPYLSHRVSQTFATLVAPYPSGSTQTWPGPGA